MKFQTKKILKNTSFSMATERIKYFRINLTKNVKELYTENRTSFDSFNNIY